MDPNESDIVTINVGGEIIQAHRTTLCLANESMFAAMFSGRWDDGLCKDAEGRIFLDHDPDDIRLIIRHLRQKRIEDPSDPTKPPCVAEEHYKDWARLLHYFGLFTFFYPPKFQISDLNVSVANKDCLSCRTVEGRLEFDLQHQEKRNRITLSGLPDTRFGWKATINNITPQPGKLALGASKIDGDRFKFRGLIKENKMFAEGECLYFLHEDGKLKTVNLTTKERSARQLIDDGTSISIVYQGTSAKLTLEAVDQDELAAVFDF